MAILLPVILIPREFSAEKFRDTNLLKKESRSNSFLFTNELSFQHTACRPLKMDFLNITLFLLLQTQVANTNPFHIFL